MNDICKWCKKCHKDDDSNYSEVNKCEDVSCYYFRGFIPRTRTPKEVLDEVDDYKDSLFLFDE